MGILSPNSDGYNAVQRGIRQLDLYSSLYWMQIIEICLEEHKRTKGDFAGAWVFSEATRRGLRGFNNLRPLSSRGIIQKVGDSRRGQRAYYTVPDMDGVKKAVEEFRESNPIQKVTKQSDLVNEETVKVPYYGNLASCGSPNMSESYIEDYLDVNTFQAKPGHDYFIVRVDGDSMNRAGIDNGDLVLVRAQHHADVGQKVVVYLDNGATIKELQYQGNHVLLVPRSNNSTHKPIILTANAEIQGVVVATLPRLK